MRTKLLFGLITFLLLTTGAAWGQTQMNLDHVEGLTPELTLTADGITPIIFHIGMNNTSGSNIKGWTNGFHVYTTTGAQWTIPASDTIGYYTGVILPSMAEQKFVNQFSVDGIGADTVGFGGFSLFAPGIPTDLNEIVWTINIGTIDPAYNGGEICLDTSFYPPAGGWSWSTPSGPVLPTWGGPQCFAIGEAASNTAPVFNPIGNKIGAENSNLTFVVSATDADLDPLTYSITSTDLPTGYTFVDGTFDWTPSFSDEGAYTVTFQVSDGTDTDEEIISITIANTNQAPILSAIGDKSTDEGINLSFPVFGSDPDGDDLTYSITSTDLPTGYTFAASIFNWNPAFDEAGVYSVTFQASDGDDTDEETITITVLNTNRAPELNAIGNKETDEGVNLNFAVTGSDPDADAVTFSITDTDLPAGYTFVGGVFDWTPGSTDDGIYSVTFEISDGLLTADETISITVIDVNNAPVFDPLADQIVSENSNLNFAVNAIDPEGDGLTYSISASDLPGGHTFVGSTFDWTPTFDDEGVYSVTFSVTDGVNPAVEQIISITVNNTNRAPVFNPIADQIVSEDSNLNFAVSATDADLDGLTYSITTNDLPGGHTFIDGVFDWTPTFDDEGIYSVTFSVTDGADAVETTISVTVNNTNRAPVLGSIGNQEIDEGALLTFTASATDDDGEALTFSITATDLPIGYTFVDGVFEWTPGFTEASVYSATIEVTDGDLTDTETISITVNDSPRWVLDPIGDKEVSENSNLTFPVPFSNPDSEILTLTASGVPVGATFDGIEFVWNTTFDDEGEYFVTFTLTDGDIVKDETISILVTNVNRAPVLTAIGDKFVDEDANLNFALAATDDDGDDLTFSISATDLPVGYTFVDGVFDWTTTFDDEGVYSATFVVSDGDDTSEETIAITVTDVNRAPSIDSPGDKIVNEGVNLNFAVTGDDPDGDGLTFSISSTNLPVGYTFVDGVFDWIPGFEDAGIYSATFQVTDGEFTAETTITIEVVNFARWSLIPIGDKEVLENDNLGFTITYSNPDSDDLTLTSTALPGTATLTGDVFDWTTTFDDAGIYPVTFTITDGVFSQDETINITVTNVNRAPEMTLIGNKETDENINLNFTVLATDDDGDALTFSISATDLPVGYTFVDGVFDWTPSFDDDGVYSATFSVTDGTDAVEEIISITVNNVNRVPVLTAIGDKTGSENSQLTFVIVGSDPDGDDLIYTMTSIDLPVEASFDVNTQTFDWTPAFGEAETYSATFTVSDGVLSTEETISIVISATNRTPVVDAIDDFNIDECDVIDVIFTSTDPDGDALALSVATLVDGMTFTDLGDGTGRFQYNPTYDSEGSYPLTLTVFDGSESVLEDFTVNVTDCLPPYILSLGSPATVPGSRVAIALTYENACELVNMTSTIGWTSELMNLDSVSFVGSNVDYLVGNSSEILAGTATINSEVGAGETNIPAGGGLFATLHFSLDAGIAENLYPITINSSQFVYDCGEGLLIADPLVINGGVLIQFTETFVCGTVIDDLGVPIEGSTVELWDDFPFAKGVQLSTTTNSFGSFAFADVAVGTFSLYAYQESYYPGIERDLNSGTTGIMITQKAVPAVVMGPEWVNLYCDFNTLNDVAVPVGTVIDAYSIDGVHAGTYYVTTEGSYGFMSVYGSDIYSGNGGILKDEPIRLFINEIEAFSGTDPTWTGNGDRIEACLSASHITTQSCELVEGWNLVSWRNDTNNDEIANVLASLGDCIEVVLGFEQGGLTYDPTLPAFSTLNEVDHLSGYWIKIAQGCATTMLEIDGAPVPAISPISLTTGWNLVSYLPEETLPTENALGSIHDNLTIALGFDGAGLTYTPNNPNATDMDDMSSCFGYWVKVTQDDILTYPGAGTPAKAVVSTAKLATDAGKNIPKSTSWVNLYSHQLTLNDISIGSGSEITAHNLNGDIIGSYTIGESGRFGFMSVYADDPTSKDVDGVVAGESFYLSVDGHKTNETFTWTQSGDRIEVAALTTSDDVKGSLPGSYSLNQNYPNPFNPTTTIKFSLAKSGQAKLQIFNILGEVVATPFNSFADAGQNEVVWDGKDNNGKSVSSGIYFYRLTADNYTETKKMTLLK